MTKSIITACETAECTTGQYDPSGIRPVTSSSLGRVAAPQITPAPIHGGPGFSCVFPAAIIVFTTIETQILEER